MARLSPSPSTDETPGAAVSQPSPDRANTPGPVEVHPGSGQDRPEEPYSEVSAQSPGTQNTAPRHEASSQAHPPEPSRRHTDAGTAASIAAAWPTKRIYWPPGSESTSLIIMQAKNGPCSLIALCNVLILRGDMAILPTDRKSVSYEYLAQLIADYLVSRTTDDSAIEGLSAALSKLPELQEGMDINSVWTSSSSFKQLGEGGELKLFHLCSVDLVHGWLADPSSQEYEALIKVEDYDGAVNKVVAADSLTHGRLVESDQPNSGQQTATLELTKEQQALVKDALLIREFLESNSSQLTYFGLFHLSTTLSPGLYALFRNSHLSVLYKTGLPDHPLYTLVTDSVFTREPAVCWETLEDVDGSASMFVDAHLVRSSTAGGDYSGRSAEAAVRDAERGMEDLALDSDAALARQLQAEEDAVARARHAERTARRGEQERWNGNGTNGEQRYPGQVPQRRSDMPPELRQQKKKKSGDCVIM
ncbi:hypothetical protein FRB90_006434 [Tulasnella sp. 427]|nr:hypothetical protein FRB90_006434 [Tulasnella sp. 427]